MPQLPGWLRKGSNNDLNIPSLRQNVETSIQQLENLGYKFYQDIRLATRQEFQIFYTTIMTDPYLSGSYKLEFADSAFDIVAAPYLRAMDRKEGVRIVYEVTMIYSGMQQYFAGTMVGGGVTAQCRVWEPYIVGNEVTERQITREVDADTALRFQNILRRQEDGHTDEPRGEIIAIRENPLGFPVGRQLDEMEEALILRRIQQRKKRMDYVLAVDIFPAYKFSMRVAWGNIDVGFGRPIIIQPPNSNNPFGGSGGNNVIDPDLKRNLKGDDGGTGAA